MRPVLYSISRDGRPCLVCGDVLDSVPFVSHGLLLFEFEPVEKLL